MLDRRFLLSTALAGTVLLVALTAPATLPAHAQDEIPTLPEGVEIIGGDAESLNQLALRFAINIYTLPIGSPTTLRIYPADIPPDLPFELPIPEDADVIGTFARVGAENAGAVYLSAPLSQEAVVEFYADTLDETVWEQAESMAGGGGFMPTPIYSSFCGENDTVLTVGAFPAVNAPTDADMSDFMINYQIDANYSPCEQPTNSSDYRGLFPALTPPDGVSVSGNSSGGGGGDSYYQETTLATTLTAGELVAAYNPQLAEAGWTELTTIDAETTALSTWTFTDEEGETWNGLLLMSRTADEEDALAMLQIRRIDD